MTGQDRIKRKFKSIAGDGAEGVRGAIRGAALVVETTAKDLVRSGQKTGRIYEKYNPRRTHRASAPGEPPATVQGRLLDQITHVLDADGFGANVESRAAYSRPLEFGTVNMGARPFLHPALEKNKAKIKKVIGEAIKRATKTT